MKKQMIVVLSKEEQKKCDDAILDFFEELIDDWEADKIHALEVLRRVFLEGKQVYLPSGAVVTVKLTLEKFKELIGEDAYKSLVRECQVAGIATWTAVGVEFLTAEVLFALFLSAGFSWIVYLSILPVVAWCGVWAFDKSYGYFHDKKEVNKDDKRVLEVCEV